MSSGQRHEFFAPAPEEWIGGDNQPACAQSSEGVEGGRELTVAAGLQDRELHPLRARSFLHVSNDTLGSRTVWVDEQPDASRLRNQLGQQFEPLGRELDGDEAD